MFKCVLSCADLYIFSTQFRLNLGKLCYHIVGKRLHSALKAMVSIGMFDLVSKESQKKLITLVL